MRGLRALGFRGGHCADPHKQAVMPLLDRTTETAAMVGSVNLIFRDGDALVGDNTEGKGVVHTIRRTLDPAGKQVVLLGAGRVARAVAVELAAAGAAGLTIVNRTEARAAELVALLAGKFEMPVTSVAWQGDYAVPPEAEILIRATSQQTAGDEPTAAGVGQPAARVAGGRRDCRPAANAAAGRSGRTRLQDGRRTEHVHRAGGHQFPIVDGRRSRTAKCCARPWKSFWNCDGFPTT